MEKPRLAKDIDYNEDDYKATMLIKDWIFENCHSDEGFIPKSDIPEENKNGKKKKK